MKNFNLISIIVIIFLNSCTSVTPTTITFENNDKSESIKPFESFDNSPKLQINENNNKTVSANQNSKIEPIITLSNVPTSSPASSSIPSPISTVTPTPTIYKSDNNHSNVINSYQLGILPVSNSNSSTETHNIVLSSPSLVPIPSITPTPNIIPIPSITPSPTPVLSPTPNVIAETQSLNFNVIEKLIWEKTNQERQKEGLFILSYEDKIAGIAREHSKNMAENNFFSHTDPEGLSASDRISKGYPELFSTGSAENIAYNFGKTEEEAAENLMKAWMNSSGHRANILNSSLTYIGVGIYIKGSRIYATQNFIKPVSVPVTDLTKVITYGESTNLTFKFYSGVINKDNLTVFVKFPDSTAKFYLPNNSYFTGQGKYIPQWENDLFTINLTCDKGKGDYLIKLCENNNCYNTNYKIIVN